MNILMNMLTLILATSIALGSSAMAQNNDKARDRAERREPDERGEMGYSDDRTAFWKKLVALFEAGKISREEAGDLYKTAFPERSGTPRQYQNKRLKEVKPLELFNEARQNPIFSGPQPGEKLVSFQAVGYLGEHKGKMLDPIAMANNQPHLIVFQDDNLLSLRFFNELLYSLAAIDGQSDVDLHVSLIFLSDDPDVLEPYERTFPMLLGRGIDVIAFSKEGREGPGAYGLDRTMAQTFVLAKGGQVVHNLAVPTAGLDCHPHVLGGIADIIGEKRETVQAWLNKETTGGREMRRR